MKTIIESISEYIETCPLLEDLADVLIDFLPENTMTLSIEPTPTETVTEWYVDGSTTRQYQFVIATRFDYAEEIELQLNNSGFFEKLQDWMEEKSEAGDLPQLEGNRKATSIEAVSSGYLYNVDPTVRAARYQIQCVLRYEQEAK